MKIPFNCLLLSFSEPQEYFLPSPSVELKAQLQLLSSQMQAIWQINCQLHQNLLHSTFVLRNLTARPKTPHSLLGSISSIYTFIKNRPAITKEIRVNFNLSYTLRLTQQTVLAHFVCIKKLQEEFNSARLKHAMQRVYQLNNQSTFSAIEIEAIFYLEYTLRSSIEASADNSFCHAQLLKLTQHVLKLTQHAKNFLTSRPFHVSAASSARCGQAATRALYALVSMQKGDNLTVFKECTHWVLVHKRAKCIFKFNDPRAAEEEWMVNELFNLTTKSGAVGNFRIGRSWLAHLPLLDLKQRSFTFDSAPSHAPRLIPDTQHPDMERAYARCEKHVWKYRREGQKEVECKFKDFHFDLIRRGTSNVKSVTAMDGNKDLPADPTFDRDLHMAIDTKWRLTWPDPSAPHQFKGKIDVKPFLAMWILGKICASKALTQGIFKRLSEDAEFNAIAMAELQPLDMHLSNIGLRPDIGKEFKKFSSLEFYHQGQTSDFGTLLENYLEGSINEDFVLSYYDPQTGLQVEGTLESLPELKKVLEARWNWVFFDTNLALTEDNELQCVIINNQKRHLIPFRSELLVDEIAWKDQPLSQACLERLLNSKERDQLVISWIQNKDAPLWRRLSPQAREWLHHRLLPEIERYSLTYAREHDIGIRSVQDLRLNFQQNMKDMSRHADLWQRLQCELNQDFTSTAADEKRMRLAGQLFPRLTARQQRALIERQQCRSTYLLNYQKLSQAETQAELLAFIDASTTPLSYLERKKIKQAIEASDYEIKTQLLQACQPTYFNVVKAMYPYLADAYELNKAVYKGQQSDLYIGHFHNPLETTIDQALQQFPTDSPLYKLAQRLLMHIQSKTNPAFMARTNV